MKKFKLKGTGITGKFPDGLELEFIKEESDENTFYYDREDCGITFLVKDGYIDEDESREVFDNFLAELDIDPDSIENDDIQCVNGEGTFIMGANKKDSSVLNIITILISQVSEQTLIASATFNCSAKLVGNIIGSITFPEDEE
jgi:hypothetical protein